MKLEELQKKGKKAKGKEALETYLETFEKLSRKNAIEAKCMDCMGYYKDGKFSCGIITCPLYPYMPYKSVKQKRTKKRKVQSQKESD